MLYDPDKAKTLIRLNSVIRTNWRMEVLSTVWFHFPAGPCACLLGTVGSGLDCHKLQWIYWQRPTNSPDVNPLDYYVWGVELEHYTTFYPSDILVTEWISVLVLVSFSLINFNFYSNSVLTVFLVLVFIQLCRNNFSFSSYSVLV